MTSKVTIISQAFVLLGRKVVTSLDPDLDGGEPVVVAASQFYDDLYPALLTCHPWRFAMKTFNLNELSTAPITKEWQKAYQLPSDLIMPWRPRPLSRFEIFEDEIYSNTPELQLDYIFKVDESKFPTWFTLMLVYELAANLAMTVTQQPALAQLWNTKAEQQLMKARFIDSKSRTSDVMPAGPLFTSHFT